MAVIFGKNWENSGFIGINDWFLYNRKLVLYLGEGHALGY
jgi:hypothetical protein